MRYAPTNMYTIIVGANHIIYLVKKYGEIDGIPSTSPHPGVKPLTVYRRESESRV